MQQFLTDRSTVREPTLNIDDTEDYWTQQTRAPKEPATLRLTVQTIEGVEPLDAQLGVQTPKTVPDLLYETFFGLSGLINADLVGADEVPTLHTYAILDAAKVTNLPELLETSGLEHRCLFKGVAYDELRDVAPWIVRLEYDSSFTRNLFTRSEAPWHLWNTEPGIYLRSQGTLDQMWGHVRKFTKVQDERGKWYYFRFWEPSITAPFLRILEPDQLIRVFQPVDFLISILPDEKKAEVIQLS